MPQTLASVNAYHEVIKVPLNDIVAVEKHLRKKDIAAVIIEGIQGFGGYMCLMPGF